MMKYLRSLILAQVTLILVGCSTPNPEMRLVTLQLAQRPVETPAQVSDVLGKVQIPERGEFESASDYAKHAAFPGESARLFILPNESKQVRIEYSPDQLAWQVYLFPEDFRSVESRTRGTYDFRFLEGHGFELHRDTQERLFEGQNAYGVTRTAISEQGSAIWLLLTNIDNRGNMHHYSLLEEKFKYLLPMSLADAQPLKGRMVVVLDCMINIHYANLSDTDYQSATISNPRSRMIERKFIPASLKRILLVDTYQQKIVGEVLFE